MKKLTCVALVIIMMLVCLTNTVYAAPKCNFDIVIEKSEYTKGDEFSAIVKLSGIESENGIIGLRGTLEYSKDSLELKGFEGLNGWMTPIKNQSYNEETGVIVLEIQSEEGIAKSDKSILKINFKVRDDAKNSATVSFKNIEISDVTTPLEIQVVSKGITIREKSNNQGGSSGSTNQGQTGTQKPSTDQSGTSTNVPNKNSSDTYKGKLPQTGAKEGIILVIGGIVLTLGIVSFKKMKKM